MKKHRGMRSHDIVVLLKISTLGGVSWFLKDVAYNLGISQSEVSESLNRSKIAGLLSADKKIIMKNNLLDFLVHGLRYVFPVEPGAIQRGLFTAHNAPPLNHYIESDDHYVWSYAEGEDRGQAIEALHPKVPQACNQDPKLYELLALLDSIRLGRVREQQMAIKELKQRIFS